MRVVRAIYYIENDKTNEWKRDFRIQLLDRHFKQCHGLGKTVAVDKKEKDREKLNVSLVNAMSDQVTGNYAMFRRGTFQTFFNEACSFSKRYREVPDLNFHPKAIARLVSAQAGERMQFLKKALNDALREQRKQMHSGIDLDERIVVTAFMDHCTIKEMKKKLGCVSIIIRITKMNRKSSDLESNFYSIPIYIFDVNDCPEATGQDANANAYHYYEALKTIFDPENMQFVAAVFDGAIFDKKKEGFVRNLKQRGLLLVDKIFFTCNTHGHALCTTLSMTRCMKDLGLKYDGPDGQPDPERRAPDCIWFKNEKQTYTKSFATFNLLLKTLKEKGKKKSITFADFIYLLAYEDYKSRKESGCKDLNPQRTNSPYLRWKEHYFQEKNEQEEPRRLPTRMIKENDKKLRRYYTKCVKLLDNIPFAKIAMKNPAFKELFQDIKNPEIDPVFENHMSQWCAVVKLLWSINDSTKEGFNCSLLRSLLIVLKATTEQNRQHSALDNVLLR